MNAPKPTLPALLAVIALLGAASASAQDLKVATFDPNRIFTDSKMGQALQEQLNEFRVQQEAGIKKSAEELKRLLDQYKAGVDDMSPERRDQIEQDLAQRRRDLERDQKDAEAELRRRQQRGLRELETELDAVLGDYAKRNGYTLVLDRNICAYSLDSIDISADLVRLVDARTK